MGAEEHLEFRVTGEGHIEAVRPLAAETAGLRAAAAVFGLEVERALEVAVGEELDRGALGDAHERGVVQIAAALALVQVRLEDDEELPDAKGAVGRGN